MALASRLAFARRQCPTARGRTPLFVVFALLALFAVPTSAFAVSPHVGSADKTTCVSCHVPHQAATAESILKDVGPVKGETPLCYTCHDGVGAFGNVKTGPDSFVFGNGHVLEGVATTASARDLTNSCSDCHKPHGDPALRPSLPGSKVNSATVGTTGNVWCFACHDDAQSWYAMRGSYPALSNPSRDASGYPTAGTFAGASVYASPTANAHIGIPARSGAATRTAGDCLYCHNAHGSASRYDSLSATFSPSSASSVATDRATGAYAALCFTCHGGGSWETSGAANIKRYVTHEATDTGAFASGGHRIKSAGAKLPVEAPLPCYDCHNPHGSSRDNKRLLSDALGASLDTSAGPEAVRRFCLTCHVTSETLGWDSVAATYTAVPASATVEGLRRDGGAVGSGPNGVGKNWLYLKTTPGHARADTSMSCYDCHGSEYGTDAAKNVHDPGAYSVAIHTGTPSAASITILGQSYGPYACTTCHAVELGPEHAKSTSSGNTLGCAECHPTPRASLSPGWNRSTCAQNDCHAGTSTAPMHAEKDADHTAAGPCTVSNCHNTSAAAIHSVVGGPGCAACHAGGVTPTLACRACHMTPHPTENHGTGTDACGSCHSTGKLMGVHSDDCGRCHPVPAQGMTYAGGCQQAGCHVAATTHTGLPGYYQGHDEPPGWHDWGWGDCFSCHPSDGGGCEACHTYDRTPPTAASNARASYVAAAVIRLSAVDVGSTTTYYQIDGGAIQSGGTVVVAGPASGTKAHTIEFWASDAEYNTGTHHIAYFTITAGVDSAAPTGAMSVNSGATYTTSALVTVNSSVTDAATGVAAMRVDPGSGTFGPWIDYSPAYSMTLVGGDGTRTVRVQYKDAFDNMLTLTDSIIQDATLPTGLFRVNNDAFAINTLDVTLDINVTDALTGMSQMRFKNGTSLTWSAWEPYAPTKSWTLSAEATGNRWISGQFSDVAGNIYWFTDTIIYDVILPTGTMSVNNDAASTNSTSVTLNSNVIDVDTGVIQMRVDPGSGTFGSWIPYASSHALTLPAGEGIKTVRAEYIDRAGNVYALTDTIVFTSVIDAIPPTGSILVNAGASWASAAPVTLTLAAADTGGSGLYQMRFSNNGTDWSTWEAYATTKTWALAAGSGSRTAYVQYRDGVGNVSSTYTDAISIETVGPTGSVVINGGAMWTDQAAVTLTLAASDTGGSGLSQVRFSNDYTVWSDWETFATSKSWTLGTGASIKAVYVQFRDAAGNTSTVYLDTIAYLLDMTLTYTPGPNGSISGAGTQSVHYGSSGTAVTAVPNSGFRFLAWSDGVMTATRTDTNVLSDLNVEAWFAANGTHTVQFVTDGNGYLTGQWIQGVANGGSATAVTATSWDSAYTFSYWFNGTTYSYGNPLTLTNVTGSSTWTAYFSYSGSCPFLFTWDGSKYVFEADEFAAGKLGLQTSKGYRRPNPLDYHILATEPASKDGALEFKLVEERDEVDYLDQAKLYTVDAPADRDVYIERSQAEGVGRFTTLDAVIHTTEKNLQPPPSVIWLNTGEDVRSKVASSDKQYVVLNDDRNDGYNYQTLELDLGNVQSAAQTKLVIDGRTMIPTSPAGRVYSRTFGPQVKFEVQDASGKWVAVPTTNTILPKPPEFTRPFVLDLSRIWISDSRKVRLTYLYKTYIDSLLLDTTADVPVTITELPLLSADLQAHGFNFRTGFGELFEYVYGDPASPPRYRLPGNHTRFGEVSPLLGTVDDKFVIFGGGDELTLRFAQPETASTNLTRRYLFLSNGYYKDLKENIAHTVDPLPFAAMSNFPYPDTEHYPTDAEHQQYLSEWNTRYEE